MPRWLLITLAFVLYAAIMAAVVVGARALVPGFSGWLGQTFGEGVATILVFGVIGAAGIYGFWPRRPDGTMRRLRSPWD